VSNPHRLPSARVPCLGFKLRQGQRSVSVFYRITPTRSFIVKRGLGFKEIQLKRLKHIFTKDKIWEKIMLKVVRRIITP